MRSLVIAFVAFAVTVASCNGDRPTRFFDSQSTPAFPACSASYATPCAFNNVYRLVERVSSLIEASSNLESLFTSINNASENIQDGFFFAPYVFNSTSMRCIANGRDISFYNLTIEEIAQSLGVTSVQDDLSSEMHSTADESEDGWFKFVFVSEDYVGEPIAHIGYAKQAQDFNNNTYIVMASLAYRLLPRMDIDACPTSVNRRCNIQNVRSLVGAALYEAMTAESEASLREVWSEITFPRPDDITFRDQSWYIFVFEFGDGNDGDCYAHLNYNWIRWNLYGISKLFIEDVQQQDGSVIHEHFSEAALQGGGWVKYNWTTSPSVPALLKVSYVTGVELFNRKYYIGAGFNHMRDPVNAGPVCSQCSASYSSPCAIGNVLSLSAHTEVELLTKAEANVVFTHISEGQAFKMDGGFGIILVDYNQTVMADSLFPDSLNQDAESSFAERSILFEYSTHESLMALADGGGGWIQLSGIDGHSDFIAFVNKISKFERSYYLLNGYYNERAPTVDECSAEYSDECSEINAKALVGDVVTSIQVASSDSEFTSILESINTGKNSSYFITPNFYAIVLDSDFNLLAHGDTDLFQTWNISVPDSYMSFVQQEEGVSSLGNDFEAELRSAAFKVGGGFVSLTWNTPEQNLVKTAYVQAAKRVSSTTGASLTYYVLTMFINAPAPTLDSAGCPTYSYGVNHNDGLPVRCECGFYYMPEYSVVENENCVETFVSNYSMTCIADPSKTSIDGVKNIAMALGMINCLFAFACIMWTVAMRRHVIVKASQPLLLVLVGVGTIVSSTTIFVMVIDDKVGPPAGEGINDQANWACMAQPWFYGAGFAITYCSMIVKLRRVAKVFKSAVKMSRKVRGVSFKMTLLILMGLLSVEFLILIIWTTSDPLKFVRPEESPLNGSCESTNARTFLELMAVYHLILLFYGAYLSYRCRKMNGVFAETKYLSLAMLGNLQVLLLALPVIVLTADDAETSMFIRSIAVFLNDFSTTALIFGPKVYFSIFGAPAGSGDGGSVFKSSDPKSSATNKTNRTAIAPSSVAFRSSMVSKTEADE